MLRRTLPVACLVGLFGLVAACQPKTTVKSGPENPVGSPAGGPEVIALEDYIAQDTTRPPWVKAAVPPPAIALTEQEMPCPSGQAWLPGDWHFQNEKWVWAQGHCFIGGYLPNEPTQAYMTIKEADGDSLNLLFNKGLYKDGQYQRSFFGRSKRGSDKDEGQMNILGRGR